jgi:hypothetical protein
MAMTGKTHGMRFRRSPPTNARPSAAQSPLPAAARVAVSSIAAAPPAVPSSGRARSTPASDSTGAVRVAAFVSARVMPSPPRSTGCGADASTRPPVSGKNRYEYPSDANAGGIETRSFSVSAASENDARHAGSARGTVASAARIPSAAGPSAARPPTGSVSDSSADSGMQSTWQASHFAVASSRTGPVASDATTARTGKYTSRS